MDLASTRNPVHWTAGPVVPCRARPAAHTFRKPAWVLGCLHHALRLCRSAPRTCGLATTRHAHTMRHSKLHRLLGPCSKTGRERHCRQRRRTDAVSEPTARRPGQAQLHIGRCAISAPGPRWGACNPPDGHHPRRDGCSRPGGRQAPDPRRGGPWRHTTDSLPLAIGLTHCCRCLIARVFWWFD
jgi:hypothetical protein